MSQENVEIVRLLFSAFEQAGPEGTFRFLSPEIEWEVRPDLPDSRTYSGAYGQTPLLAAFWLRDGKVYREETFTDRAEALEAVGLSEQDAHADA